MTRSEYYKEWRKENKEKMATYAKKYYINNKEKIRANVKIYYQNNRATHRASNKRYYQKNKEIIGAKHRAYNKIYCKNNKEKIRNYSRVYILKYVGERMENDISFKLRFNLARRINHTLRDNYKSKSTIELLGCSLEDFKIWIESQFQDGMTWENYGQWHLDHAYPCAKFNLEQPYEQKICFNWFNLQPLWAKDNLQKSAKINI